MVVASVSSDDLTGATGGGGDPAADPLADLARSVSANSVSVSGVGGGM